MATAIFQDGYGGATPMVLRQIGRRDRWVWDAAPSAVFRCPTPGYRPVPKARAIAIADNDPRFSFVTEAS